MNDYGHELLFGAFITPVAQPAQQAVELALAAERAGLDLATFQDHPYQPRFHDTWTLLSYIAARTQRIRISANVHNLPLRQPAVLARSAASLDLLSGGRFEMALGAGGFWDAIAAMGGRRLSPGESIEALGEAIEIMRMLWDTEERSGARLNGKFYQVNGAKRGPAPAHPIEIWVGAYKPRILALVGQLADGWVPSLAYLENGLPSLGRMNQLIDEAAEAAGRPLPACGVC
ncbi:MAG: LLM class flavin-dependent oxidoreductase [Anaerolineales bacterium]|nr:LLM class flavin-dependent oxidoreductase [Anaerolineales bacterium]